MGSGDLWTEVELSRKLNLGRQYLREEKTDRADQLFLEGMMLAQEKGLFCWELQFEVLRLQIPIYYTFDYAVAVDAAVKLVNKAREQQYDSCETRATVYDLLVHACFYRDCIGYETEIRVVATYVDEEFPQEKNVRLRMEYVRSALDLELGQYASAKMRVKSYLEGLQDDQTFRRSDGYRLLYRYAYSQGDFLEAMRAAKDAMRHDEVNEYQPGVGEALLAQALFAKHLGNERTAQLMLQQGIEHYDQYNLRKTLPYYDCLSTFHELDGNLDAAYAARREQFLPLIQAGTLHDLAKAHLQHIRLCGRLQKPLADPVQAAYFFQEELRRPEWFAERLEEVMNGDYWEFPWQAP